MIGCRRSGRSGRFGGEEGGCEEVWRRGAIWREVGEMR